MKKAHMILRGLICILSFSIAGIIYGNNPFTIASKNSNSLTINVLKEYSRNTVIGVSTAGHSLNGICINGRLIVNNKDFLVRILLKDKKGDEYVVMECYKELCDKSEIVFDNYCEEAAILPNVVPDTILLFIHHAKMQLENIVLSYSDNDSGTDICSLEIKRKEIKLQQSEIKAKSINAYNKSYKKLWFAGVTDLCMSDFTTKMRQLGFKENQNTGGLEYYIGGLFEMGDPNLRELPNPSLYVTNFDWRNRHGKNWMTSVKNQGGSNYCSAFSSVAVLEAIANLYFNNNLDMDLSEQEAARCTEWQAPSIYYMGMELHYPIDYIVSTGLCDEVSYPFFDANIPDCQRDLVSPIYTAQPYGIRDTLTDSDSIKKELIHHGPLISGYYTDENNDTIPDFGHAMALVGYGIVQAGDIYSANDNGIFYETDSIDVRDERVGHTYWIFKNSYYGQHEWEHDGYMYLLFNNPNMMIPACTFELPIVTWGIDETEIICEDCDGDGYYFWGLGPKPQTCPSWIPNFPDGDDSNPLKGPSDNYGYLSDIGPIS